MALLETIFSGGVGKLVKDVVGTFKLSPEARLEFERQMADNELKLRELDSNLEAKLADTAGQNIRAETTSGDKFTSRARPMFLYIVEAILAFNYIIAPIFNRQPVILPSDLLVLFGFVLMGYIGGRTFEKLALSKLEK